MLDIRRDLVRQHRFEMMAGDNPLAQLLQLRTIEQIAEFRLAKQENLQQRLAAKLKIAQHA